MTYINVGRIPQTRVPITAVSEEDASGKLKEAIRALVGVTLSLSDDTVK